MNIKDLPFSLQEALHQVLGAGERALWVGRPKADVFNANSIGRMIFSIPWSVFVTIGVTNVANVARQGQNNLGAWLFLGLIGGALLSIGAWLFLAPVWHYLSARRTVYAVTPERAVWLHGGWQRKEESRRWHEVRDVEIRLRPDGRSDVIFRCEPGSNPSGKGVQEKIFRGVRDGEAAANEARSRLVQESHPETAGTDR